MDGSFEASDATFAEVLVLRAHQEQCRGNWSEEQRLLDEAIRLAGEDEVRKIAEECIIELPAQLVSVPTLSC